MINRLPCCDRTTQRSELAVFASLGLAGAMMLTLAGVQMTKFVATSDPIAAALTLQPEGLATTKPGDAGQVVVTNLARPVAERASVPNVAAHPVLPPA